MKIKLTTFILLACAFSLLGSTNNGVIPASTRGGPVSSLDISPDGGYDIGGASKSRPGQVFIRNAVDIAGSKLIHATVNLTAANLLAMYATPVVIIPAQGSGKIIVVSKLICKVTWTTTDFANGGVLVFQYDTTANGAGTIAVDSTLAATFLTHGAAGSAGTAYSVRNGAVISTLANTSIENKGLYISNQTAAFITGTGTAVVDVWYLLQ